MARKAVHGVGPVRGKLGDQQTFKRCTNHSWFCCRRKAVTSFQKSAEPMSVASQRGRGILGSLLRRVTILTTVFYCQIGVFKVELIECVTSLVSGPGIFGHMMDSVVPPLDKVRKVAKRRLVWLEPLRHIHRRRNPQRALAFDFGTSWVMMARAARTPRGTLRQDCCSSIRVGAILLDCCRTSTHGSSFSVLHSWLMASRRPTCPWQRTSDKSARHFLGPWVRFG